MSAGWQIPDPCPACGVPQLLANFGSGAVQLRCEHCEGRSPQVPVPRGETYNGREAAALRLWRAKLAAE